MKKTTSKIKEIRIFDSTGSFAENKDKAKEIRENEILPTLKKGEDLILNYKKVSTTTQSFTHALISEAIRQYGSEVLDKIIFKNCNQVVKQVIQFVVQYMQQSVDE